MRLTCRFFFLSIHQVPQVETGFAMTTSQSFLSFNGRHTFPTRCVLMFINGSLSNCPTTSHFTLFTRSLPDANSNRAA